MANPTPSSTDHPKFARGGIIHRPRTYRTIQLDEYDHLIVADYGTTLSPIAHISEADEANKLLKHLNRLSL